MERARNQTKAPFSPAVMMSAPEVVLVQTGMRTLGVASILRTGVQIDFCPDNTDFVPTCPP
jgi:hypothetical protein